MLLHFIFVVKEEDLEKKKNEFEYVKKMAQFYKKWINENFGIDYEIKCDELITKPRSIFQRLDTHTLVRDHEQRGKDTYHFYLTHFKPLWTDCTCEGYHAENFGMIFWQSILPRRAAAAPGPGQAPQCAYFRGARVRRVGNAPVGTLRNGQVVLKVGRW